MFYSGLSPQKVCRYALQYDELWGSLNHVIGSYPKKLAPDMSSIASQGLATGWLDLCKQHHQSCNHSKSESSWLPTRLVFIKLLGAARTVHMVETSLLSPSTTYIALSHCWGKNPILTLTLDNYANLKHGLPLSVLPKTFREAFEIARWFQVEYLWIDSLCIIQDSAEDWRKEAITMQSVYKNALLTVAATGAVDGSVGCFQARDLTLNTAIEVPVTREGQASERMVCFDRWLWADGISKAPLNTRAWVVQERLLSRRVLHFGAQQMFWECRELDACEVCPQGLPSILAELHRFKSTGSGRTLEDNLAKPKYATVYEQWEYIVDAYSRSNLTRTSDKVVALSGIAAELASTYEQEYLAGLWRQHLPEQLLWKASLEPTENGRNSLASRATSYRAPSWSWLSIDGPVDAGSSHGKPVLIKIDDAHVDGDAYSIRAGFLRLLGALRDAVCEADTNGSVRLFFDLPVEGDAFGEMDDKSARPPDSVICLPINTGFFSMDGENVMFLEGLMLVPTQQGGNEFLRVGWFSADNQYFCEAIVHGSLDPSVARTLDQSPAQGSEIHQKGSDGNHGVNATQYSHLWRDILTIR